MDLNKQKLDIDIFELRKQEANLIINKESNNLIQEIQNQIYTLVFNRDILGQSTEI